MNSKFTKLSFSLVCLFVLSGFVTVEAKAEEYENNVTNWQVTEQISNPYFGGWGNCTWSAWQLAYNETGIALPSWGSAGSWYFNAMQQGWTVSEHPAVGSIIVWSSHVGYVSAVSEDGMSVFIKEGGYCGGYHEGWFPAYVSRSPQRLYGYIYLY